ncbi:hypothetical protein A2966_01695 [Candidatus Roizmanbacteria bacterium RIFCSPLOWO2_01_FULL_41_22]|uniref:DUF1189 domain-containing protein n=2 Tax=Candidatus Roizmaniibacteriota TaxID=1752723 RepID=A0A1F7JQI4_9BACT|nr:MAG: hypothetical protein A2966_01695 [Candidatus Roizmanbacteria bacterium RIFCSPLOWO2_01_FULL_41_22]OGK57869.1 MAG: hypothetical protein A3H86_03955 [Candidatus Roizmanbacteria bacterium RIFCSPLOWO2_02_FULL_41_9]
MSISTKLKTFAYIFKKSLTDIYYYPDIIKTSVKFSLKYFYLFLFFILFVQSALFVVNLAVNLPKIPQFVSQIKERAKGLYPKELIITIKNGNLRTNVKEPYYIDLPELTQNNVPDQFEHLVAFDTKGRVDDFKKYHTLFLVTRNAVVYPDRQQQSMSTYRVSYFDEVKNFILDQTLYQNFINKLLPYLDYLQPLLVVFAVVGIFIFPVLGASFVMTGHLIYLLIMSVLLWLIAKVFKNHLSYKKVFQLSIHGLTLPIVVVFLLGLFTVTISGLIYTSGFLLWMVIILSKIPDQIKTIKEHS